MIKCFTPELAAAIFVPSAMVLIVGIICFTIWKTIKYLNEKGKNW